jgi:hypothetical protein
MFLVFCKPVLPDLELKADTFHQEFSFVIFE